MDKSNIRNKQLEVLYQYQDTTEKLQEEQALYRALREFDLFQQARSIGIYCAMPHEVNTWPLIEHMSAEKVVGVPVVVHKQLRFQQVTPKTQYQKSAFGILEPQAASPIEVQQFDLLVVPGVAFTHSGQRLGYGGGFYDRLLSHYTGPTVSLAFRRQLLDQLPIEPHDQLIQHILTV